MKVGWPCLGSVAGVALTLILFIGGLATVLSLTALCWIVGIYMICIGFVVGVLEVPIIFQCVEITKPWMETAKKVTPAKRAAIYWTMCVFPFFCVGVGTILAGVGLFLTGFAYFMEFLGPPRVRDAYALRRRELNEGLAEGEEEALIGTGNNDEEFAPLQGFVDNVTQSATKAVAKAAVNQIKDEAVGKK
eukprot:m.81442 g.81442  ORF g.81442 m.81442 type:complete len:190 (+) comp12057_c0_seq3:66-635(+)